MNITTMTQHTDFGAFCRSKLALFRGLLGNKLAGCPKFILCGLYIKGALSFVKERNGMCEKAVGNNSDLKFIKHEYLCYHTP